MKLIKAAFTGLALVLASAAWAAAIDINSADAKAFEGLKGVGASKAEAIVEYRTKNGPFKSVDELDKVKGIGASTIAKNRDNLTVGGGSKAPAKAEKTAAAKDPK